MNFFFSASVFALTLGLGIAWADDKTSGLEVSKKALANLKLPGIQIDPEKWCIDIESTVCLNEGALELIACTRETKEHESIVTVGAKPRHIHTALLLLGAKPGHPSHQKAVVNDKEKRWIPVPPSGHQVKISLVVKNKAGKLVERPIKDFVVATENIDNKEEFPDTAFLFTGSVLQSSNQNGTGPRRYIADVSGSVISLSTFGDEVLCLPGIHDNRNQALLWSVNGSLLPDVGEKITLRMRPERKIKEKK